MSKFLSKKFSSLFIWSLIFLLAVFNYWPLVFQKPFWDDNAFIFQSYDLLNAPNPFVFWSSSSGFAKAWPMGFSFLWLIYWFSGGVVFIFHVICFLLHFLNGFLIYKITQIFLKKLSWFPTLFFIFHPMQVETLSWTIQIISVLSMTFFLLALYFIFSHNFEESIRGKALSLFFFAASFATKPWGLLSSVLYLKQYGKSTLNIKILFVAFFLMSSVGYFFYKSRQGVHLRFLENKNEPYYYFDINSRLQFQDKFIDDPSYFHARELMDKNKQVQLSFGERARMKLITMGNSFYFYFEKTLLIGQQTLIYPKKSFADFKTVVGFLLLSVFSMVAFLWFLDFLPYQYRFLGFSSFILIVSYIPISGVIYIPQMKFGLVSDHWYYMQAFGFGALLASFAEIVLLRTSRTFVVAVLSVFFTFSFYKSYTYVRFFSDRTAMLEENLKLNPESVIVQDLLKYEKENW